MKERPALKLEGGSLDARSSPGGFGGFLPTIFVVAAASAVVFGLLASGSGEPLVLTLIAVMAMLGLFFLFGVAAGHIRIGERMPAGDILTAAADAADEVFLVTSVSGGVIYANLALEAMFGKSEAGPLAAIEDAMAGDTDAAQAFFRLTRSAGRGEVRREDIRLKPAANLKRPSWLRITVRPFPAPATSGSAGIADASYALWQIADISGDKAREAEKIGSLESALSIFDGMPSGFIAVTAEGQISHVNSTFAHWLGLPREALQSGSRSIAELAGPDGTRLLKELAKSPQAEHRIVDLDLTRHDGRILPLSLMVEPSGAGLDSGFTVTAINRTSPIFGSGHAGDVGASNFFQSAPFGIATLDSEGRVITSNAAFLSMVLDSKPARDVRAIDALCRNADASEREQIAGALNQVLSGRGNVSPIEITAGEQKQYSRRVYMSPIAAPNGALSAALYVVDVTEQKALETRYAQAQKMEAVGKLAGGIAHDFNNVLTAIIGFSDLLLQTHRPGDPAYKDIRNIQSAANRAAGLVANLLGFSRKQTQQVSILNLADVMADMTPILKTTVSEKIELKIQSERDLWFVRADSNQIFNVVLNLVRNARDAMPSGGKLTIRTRNIAERESQKLGHAAGFMPGEYVLVEVEDSGIGMTPEVMTKIFEPFFTTKGVGKGTGLGLASVYGIVKQSGGFILPESEVGKGTTFKVYLPRYLPEADEEIDAAHAPRHLAQKDERTLDLTGTGRVLLVEDEVEVRQFAVRALKRQGYDVLEAGDGVEALEVMRNNEGTVDIVVSDVVMPEMDGPALFKELRKRNPDIKVIFVSGYPNEAFRETLGSEDFAFLPKPFSLPQLAAKVKEELSR